MNGKRNTKEKQVFVVLHYSLFWQREQDSLGNIVRGTGLPLTPGLLLVVGTVKIGKYIKTTRNTVHFFVQVIASRLVLVTTLYLQRFISNGLLTYRQTLLSLII